MKKMKWGKLCLLLLILITTVRCGKDSGGFIPLIPNFPATWFNDQDASNTFFFNNDNPGEAKGTFTGNEFKETNNINVQVGSFEGSFDNTKVEFTYGKSAPTTAAKRGQVYSGTLDNTSTKMTLNTPSGTIHLHK